MSRRCKVCGKLLQNETGNAIDNEIEMCEECWKAFMDEDEDEVESSEAIEFEEMDNENLKIEVNGKEYKGSVTTKWTESLKKRCYGILLIMVILFAVIGGWIFSLFEITFVGVLLGGVLGYGIGYSLILFLMVFITMAENISVMTDNTAKLLAMLDDKKDKICLK